MKTNLLAVSVLLLILAGITYAEYAQTAVYFTVPISLSFTVTLPGGVTNTSGSTIGGVFTPDIWFNSSSADNSMIQPCVAPGTYCQNSTVPIFEYDNTGTTGENIYLMFNASLPTGVTVQMNSSVAGTGNSGTAHSNLISVNSSAWAIVVSALPYIGANLSRAWLYADFVGYSGTNVRYLTHNSTA